ncbi:MAG: hypothetical protein ACLFM8_08475, partial [Halobacteriales archaeon]
MDTSELNCVFRVHSTLELPLEDVHEFLEEVDLPEGIADIDLTRRNNTLILKAVPTDETISKYTPAAQLKATVTENRVYVDEEHGGYKRELDPAPTWGMPEDEEDEGPESILVEYAAFKGDRETVLQNSTLQYEMFQVLEAIALIAERGTLTAVTANEGELVATRIVDGEAQPCKLEVVEEPGEAERTQTAVDWRD